MRVHEKRAKLVRDIAIWLDPQVELGEKDLSAAEKMFRGHGIWTVVGPRRGDEDCTAPKKEAEELVARLYGVTRSAIRQSIRRARTG